MYVYITPRTTLTPHTSHLPHSHSPPPPPITEQRMASNHISQALFSWTPMKECHLGSYEKEHLFEKPLTPSDVGKLNRLVIPKQHAEKYFPLDGDSGEKGLILCFEDEVGKAWSFRYSYWTSSQSYVLTKGWSRYVKEKHLDAGDIVLFERQRSDADRLYIGWKRKGGQVTVGPHSHRSLQWSPLPYGTPPVAQTSRFMAPPSNSKKLRLFGVNMEYGELVPNSSSSSSSSSSSHQHHQQRFAASQREELQLLPTYCTDLDSQM